MCARACLKGLKDLLVGFLLFFYPVIRGAGSLAVFA